ncbi:MAG TPA: response regulator, partial [Myxococcales bacterium]
MPKNLLLADDSRTIQQAVRMTFAREDVRLTAVEDGEAALEAARQSRPDLIIADVTMPRLGGYELCQRVRADAGLKEVPVLLLGGGAPIDPARAMAVGANGHMPKPFDSGKLIEQVKAILSNPSAKPAAAAAVAPPSKPVVPAPRPAAPAPRPSAPPGARPAAPLGGTAPMPRPAAPRAPGQVPPGSAARPGAPAVARPSGPPGARPPAPAARPAPPPGSRPPAPLPARPAAQARPAAAPPSKAPPPRPPARPPAPPAVDEEESPVDVDLDDEAPATPPTPLRSVP